MFPIYMAGLFWNKMEKRFQVARFSRISGVLYIASYKETFVVLTNSFLLCNIGKYYYFWFRSSFGAIGNDVLFGKN